MIPSYSISPFHFGCHFIPKVKFWVATYHGLLYPNRCLMKKSWNWKILFVLSSLLSKRFIDLIFNQNLFAQLAFFDYHLTDFSSFLVELYENEWFASKNLSNIFNFRQQDCEASSLLITVFSRASWNCQYAHPSFARRLVWVFDFKIFSNT